MAIGGVVITVLPDDRREVELALARLPELTVYGGDEKGNILASVKSDESNSFESVIKSVESIDSVCKVKLAYINKDNSSDFTG